METVSDIICTAKQQSSSRILKITLQYRVCVRYIRLIILLNLQSANEVELTIKADSNKTNDYVGILSLFQKHSIGW